MSGKEKTDVWMPLVIGDYKKHTGRLTRDLHGGYLLLIMEYWVTGPLLDDDADLAAIVLATPREWKAIRPKLERFFTIADGMWRHNRIDEELVEAAENKTRNIERAKIAAAARWGSDDPDGKGPRKAKRNATSMPKALRQECPSPSPRRVDDPKGQSTPSDRDALETRHEGVSDPRFDPIADRPILTLVEPVAKQLCEMTRDERRAVVDQVLGREPRKAIP